MTIFKIIFPNKEVSPLINVNEDETFLDLKSKILDSLTNKKLKRIIKNDFQLKLYLPNNRTYLAEGMDPCQPDIVNQGATLTPIMLRQKIKDSSFLRVKCNDDSYMLFLTSRNYNISRFQPEDLGNFYENYGSKKKKSKRSKKSKKSRKSRKY